MDDNGVEIEFVEVHHKVKVDLTKLTWGDALSLQKAQTDPAMTDDEREHMTTAMVSKITGEDASTPPAVVVARVLKAISERTGQATTGKN